MKADAFLGIRSPNLDSRDPRLKLGATEPCGEEVILFLIGDRESP